MLIAAAIELAQSGFIIDGGDVETFAEGNAAFARYPNAAAIFLKDGKPLAVGDRLVQTDLAASLRDISDGERQPSTAARSPEPLSRQARQTVAFLRSRIALIRSPSSIRWSVPTAGTWSSAPRRRSGGVTLCEMLTILRAYPLGQYGWRSAQEVHLMTEAMRRAYFDRNTYLGDPDFINNPVDRLMGDTHAKAMRATILPDRATPSAQIGVADAPSEHANTTHYSVVDRWGNAVAVTYTINDDFGAKIIAGGTGFFLNDEMDDFTAKPGSPNGYGLVQGKANAIAPGKRPLSLMTPTILLKNGQPVMVVGTPGGARIITTILEIIVAVVDHHVPLQEAVDAPRYHHQWLPDTLQVEPGALSPSTVAALETMGHRVTPLERWGTGNSADVIAVRPGRVLRLEGVNDIRAPGGSAVAP